MRILFDENVPRPLRDDLQGHEITTVGQLGWGGIRNGTLLGLAVPNQKLVTLLPLVPEILTMLASKLQPGTVSVVGTWRVPVP